MANHRSSTVDSRLPEAAKAFDAIAPAYAELWDDSLLGRLQRDAVWQVVERTFRPGDRLLDLGCGTGCDAVRLARMGARVHACDVSREMIRIAKQKAETEGLSARVSFEVRAIEDLAALEDTGPFDGALSNFGALNCLHDLRKVARDLAPLLRPGATLFACIMGRFCLWESLWFFFRGDFRKAGRRWRGVSVDAALGSRQTFKVDYPSPGAVAAGFSNSFRLESYRGIGLLVPPSYLEEWARRAPYLFRFLATLDRIFSSWPLVRNLSDHQLFVLVRKESA